MMPIIPLFFCSCCSKVVQILMATYKAVVSSHHKRKDGSYNIKIRVTHNRVSRWIPTNLYCTQAELTRTLKLKDGTLIDSCNQLIKRMRRALSDIPPFVLESYSSTYQCPSYLIGNLFIVCFHKIEKI